MARARPTGTGRLGPRISRWFSRSSTMSAAVFLGRRTPDGRRGGSIEKVIAS
jgi:hypothetical protein